RNRPLVRTGLWITVLVAFSTHFLWIAAVVVFVWLALSRFSRRAVGVAATTLGVVVILSAYLLVPSAGRGGPIGTGVLDLAPFRTHGDPRFGLIANVVG